VTAPAWIAACFAALMLLVAACSASRLAIGRLRHRRSEPDADALHVLMGIAMAGMLEPRLGLVSGAVWRAVFAAAAAWFAWQTIRARSQGRPAGPPHAHPAPSTVECGAMIYMLMPASHGPGTAMPGMSGPASAGNPALALVLAVFMLGYILWTTDRLTSMSRVKAATAQGTSGRGQSEATFTSAASSPLASHSLIPATAAGLVSRNALAPRFAACYKIAMSFGMGYMLVMML
jgi:hypothetical protein